MARRRADAERLADREGWPREWRKAEDATAAVRALPPLRLDLPHVARMGMVAAAREARAAHPLIGQAGRFLRALEVQRNGGPRGAGRVHSDRDLAVLGSAITHAATRAMRAHAFVCPEAELFPGDREKLPPF